MLSCSPCTCSLPLPSAISFVKAKVPFPFPAATPSSMMASPAPSPIPPPSHAPKAAAPMPPAHPHYPPGPSVQDVVHPAPPYPSQQCGYFSGQPSAAYPSQSLAPLSSKVKQTYGGPAPASSQPPSVAVSNFSSSPSAFVKVKLSKDGKFTQFRLDVSDTIESIRKRLFEMYGCDVVLEYTDPQLGMFTILSTDDVKEVFSLAQKQTDGLFCLTVSAAATSSSSSHVAPSVGGVSFPSTLPPSSSPYGSGPHPSYPSHPLPSFPPHAAPPQSLTPLPVEQRTFQTSHFKRFYAAAHVPEFQHEVFANLMAIIKWDCERRNIDVKGEGTTFFQVFHFDSMSYFKTISNVCLISSSSSHYLPFLTSNTATSSRSVPPQG
jgi:hypothetical protein